MGKKPLIVTNPTNIFYLAGFRGLSPTEREAILIYNKSSTLIVPRLYQEEAKKLKGKNLQIEVADERNKLWDLIAKITKGNKKVYFEENSLTFAEYTKLKKSLTGTVPVPGKNQIEKLRMKKTKEEIAKIERAQIISQKAFEKLIKTIKVGQTEVEIADKLAKIIKDLGGDGLAFESIVATGTNSALPHYLTGKEKVKKGQVLLFDFGAKYKNYCADLSRTIFVGKPKDEVANIYKLVEIAQKEAIKKIKHKTRGKKAFEAAHGVFKVQKVHNYFTHSLGHGIGLEVHEAPYLRRKGKDTLEEGHVFSVEPGLYFPAWGGVRIEDLVTIKNGKARILGKLQEDLIVI